MNEARPAPPSPCARLAGISLAVLLVVQLLLVLVHNSAFQDHLTKSWGSAGQLSVDPATLINLRTYLVGSDPALLGDLQFSYRERVHFREVRDRLRFASQLRDGALALCLGFVIMAVLRGRRRAAPWRPEVAGLTAATGQTLAVFLAVMLLLVGTFDSGFALLHLPLFTGVNWILPTESLTLRLFPSSYFVGFITWICGLLTVAVIGLLTVARLLRGSRHSSAVATPGERVERGS